MINRNIAVTFRTPNMTASGASYSKVRTLMIVKLNGKPLSGSEQAEINRLLNPEPATVHDILRSVFDKLNPDGTLKADLSEEERKTLQSIASAKKTSTAKCKHCYKGSCANGKSEWCTEICPGECDYIEVEK